MSQNSAILLGIIPPSRRFCGRGSEGLCSAKSHLGASGPTSNMSRPTKAFGVRIPCITAARAVLDLRNTRSKIMAFGAHCLPSSNAFATAGRRIWNCARIASAMPQRSMRMSAPSWNVAARTTAGTINATAALWGQASATARPLDVCAERRRWGVKRTSTLTRVTGMAAGWTVGRRIARLATVEAARAASVSA